MRPLALSALWLAAFSAPAFAQSGSIGSQFQFDSIFKLIFVAGFMVVLAVAVSIAFFVVTLPFRVIGKVGESMVDQMRSRQYREQDEARQKNERRDRLFPMNAKPNWIEVRLEAEAGRSTLAALWDEYREARRGALTQPQFADAYQAWRNDTPAQLALAEEIARTWPAEREVKTKQTYRDALAGLERGGDRLVWAQTQMRRAAAMKYFGDDASLAEAADACEAALSVLTPAAERKEWLDANWQLADVLKRRADALKNDARAAPVLARLAGAYQRAAAALPQADEARLGFALDHGHALLRAAHAGDRAAADDAVRVFSAALAAIDVATRAETWARTKLNLASAVEAQGDCASGADARSCYERARDLYRDTLVFWGEKEFANYPRMSRKLERVEDKLTRAAG